MIVGHDSDDPLAVCRRAERALLDTAVAVAHARSRGQLTVELMDALEDAARRHKATRTAAIRVLP